MSNQSVGCRCLYGRWHRIIAETCDCQTRREDTSSKVAGPTLRAVALSEYIADYSKDITEEGFPADPVDQFLLETLRFQREMSTPSVQSMMGDKSWSGSLSDWAARSDRPSTDGEAIYQRYLTKAGSQEETLTIPALQQTSNGPLIHDPTDLVLDADCTSTLVFKINNPGQEQTMAKEPCNSRLVDQLNTSTAALQEATACIHRLRARRQADSLIHQHAYRQQQIKLIELQGRVNLADQSIPGAKGFMSICTLLTLVLLTLVWILANAPANEYLRARERDVLGLVIVCR